MIGEVALLRTEVGGVREHIERLTAEVARLADREAGGENPPAKA